VKAVI